MNAFCNITFLAFHPSWIINFYFKEYANKPKQTCPIFTSKNMQISQNKHAPARCIYDMLSCISRCLLFHLTNIQATKWQMIFIVLEFIKVASSKYMKLTLYIKTRVLQPFRNSQKCFKTLVHVCNEHKAVLFPLPVNSSYLTVLINVP